MAERPLCLTVPDQSSRLHEEQERQHQEQEQEQQDSSPLASAGGGV
jgi:hypothetical protein